MGKALVLHGKLPSVTILSLLGVCLGLTYAYHSRLLMDVNAPLYTPARPSARTVVSAIGIIEPSGGSVGVYPVRADRVDGILVQEGQEVRAGDVLYTMHTRGLEDERKVLEAQLAAAEANYSYLKEQPRQSDVAPLEQAVAVRRVDVERLELELKRTRGLFPKAVSQAELDNAEKAHASAVASLELAEAELRQLQAGASQFQLAQAQAQIEQVKAQLAELATRLEESVLRSPIDGVVMKINIHPGEYISLFNPVRDDATSTPVVVGSRSLQVRVDVDEADAHLLDDAFTATASLKGDSSKGLEITFNRIQPMAVPKKNLSGYGMERIDVRVVQVIYDVKTPDYPLWAGQQVNVFLERDNPSEQSE